MAGTHNPELLTLYYCGRSTEKNEFKVDWESRKAHDS